MYLSKECNIAKSVLIVKSSNIGTAKIATKIGKKNQIDFFKKIGFLEKLDFEILETAEPLGNKNHWGKTETMTIGYGHGFAITPLHLIKAYASIANRGIEIKPTIIKNNKHEFNNKILLKEETSKYFLELGADIIITSRKEDVLKSAKEELEESTKGKVHYVVGDVEMLMMLIKQ